jgi:hypothetical protein
VRERLAEPRSERTSADDGDGDASHGRAEVPGRWTRVGPKMLPERRDREGTLVGDEDQRRTRPP